MRGARSSFPLLLLLLSSSCRTYEYEEEVFLDLSGSGRIRVSGSKGILEAIHGIENPSVESFRAHFAGEDVEVVSVLETRRGGRPFLHVELGFADFRQLCQSPPFRERRCRRAVSDEEQLLELDSPRPSEGLPEDADPAAVLALRFHLPSTVRYHNSRTGIERGNILSWERRLGDYFEAEPFSIEVRYGRQSILAATVRIALLATALVAATIALAIYWMVRKGRRQLEAERAEAL
jgi:hypothetical protein